MSEHENPTRVTPDIDVETEPVRRLNPGEICEEQQRSVTEVVIKELP
jgi:hypothetical protein